MFVFEKETRQGVKAHVRLIGLGPENWEPGIGRTGEWNRLTGSWTWRDQNDEMREGLEADGWMFSNSMPAVIACAALAAAAMAYLPNIKYLHLYYSWYQSNGPAGGSIISYGNGIYLIVGWQRRPENRPGWRKDWAVSNGNNEDVYARRRERRVEKKNRLAERAKNGWKGARKEEDGRINGRRMKRRRRNEGGTGTDDGDIGTHEYYKMRRRNACFPPLLIHSWTWEKMMEYGEEGEMRVLWRMKEAELGHGWVLADRR